MAALFFFMFFLFQFKPALLLSFTLFPADLFTFGFHCFPLQLQCFLG